MVGRQAAEGAAHREILIVRHLHGIQQHVASVGDDVGKGYRLAGLDGRSGGSVGVVPCRALADAHLFLAMALARLDERDEARQQYERAIRVDPYGDTAETGLADQLSAWGENEEADALFSKLLRRDPENSLGLLWYARHLMFYSEEYSTEDTEAAIALLKRALAMDAHAASAHYYLALAYSWLGDHDKEALEHARKLEELKPDVKRSTIIGLAFIDTDRCLPYAFDMDCIVCEEHCPTDPKAIYFETKTVWDMVDGREVKLPVIHTHKCIGCGICENVCPVGDKAAIRVSSVGEARSETNRIFL